MVILMRKTDEKTLELDSFPTCPSCAPGPLGLLALQSCLIPQQGIEVLVEVNIPASSRCKFQL
jgi:hypothetical protein